MVIETLLGTCAPEGGAHFAPIGLHLAEDASVKTSLRLYSHSHTAENLRQQPRGSLNFCRRAEVFVDALLEPSSLRCQQTAANLPVLADSAYWLFEVETADWRQEPAILHLRITKKQPLANDDGFCRARGAVIEAAIAATRLEHGGRETIARYGNYWQMLVEKTGGREEKRAFDRLWRYLTRQGAATAENPE